ncbi:Glutamate synthase [NADPH] large chain [hydrothermal vent metagenome]|uniref:Glutamate synthase [NADPH] large chain n=1 Tax=hydrothermal vent metagenome TaxID=652676 RepID=A0A3B0Z2L9_9ZZZZ
MTLPADYLRVSIANQYLRLIQDGEVCAEYKVSTALNGPGERLGSEQTPRGWHRIRARIGAGCEAGTVFVGRRPTGEIYSEELALQYPQRDWILSRILWLSGTEPGCNRFGHVDTLRRFIYIHGCPDSEPMGEPRSHGCVRMRNADIIELFQRTIAGLPVLIEG